MPTPLTSRCFQSTISMEIEEPVIINNASSCYNEEVKNMATRTRIGVHFLTVMVQNLALNIAEKRFPIPVYNRTTSKVYETVERAKKEGNLPVFGFHDPEAAVHSIQKPPVMDMLLKAHSSLEQKIKNLSDYLDKGDFIIDGGNEWYENNERREKEMNDKRLLYRGMGVSDGEESARYGPSLMPGGSFECFKHTGVSDSGPSVIHMGKGGSGNFVKMVHNGIEYDDMQLIPEAYDGRKFVGKLSNEQLQDLIYKNRQETSNGNDNQRAKTRIADVYSLAANSIIASSSGCREFTCDGLTLVPTTAHQINSVKQLNHQGTSKGPDLTHSSFVIQMDDDHQALPVMPDETKSQTKINNIILGITGQAAVALVSSSSSDSPFLRFFAAATGIGFLGSFFANYVLKKPKMARILSKIGAIGAASAAIIALGLYFPKDTKWNLNIVATVAACLACAVMVASF